MTAKPVAKWTKAELDAEIALYKEAGIEITGDLKTNAAKIELVSKLREDQGEPREIDEKFFELNPDVDREEFKLGDVVLVPIAPEASEEPTAYDIVRGDVYVRQYSQEVHGDDFKAMAEEFCAKTPKNSKHPYTMVPAGQIKAVEVRYREKADADLHLDKQKPDAPFIDKSRRFEDKSAALSFAVGKHESTVVVSKK